MLSRVANQLYWYSRYLERAENTARLIRVNANLLLDLPTKTDVGWTPMVEIMGLDEEFAKLGKAANEKNVVHFLTLDEDNSSSILSSLALARSNLRSTRDIVAREIWEQTNKLYLYIRDEGKQEIKNTHDFLTRIIMDVNTINGLIFSVMSNDLSFQFLRLGANMERADMATRILDIRADDLLPSNDQTEQSPFDNILWMSVLKSLSAYQLYRQHVRTRVNGPDVLSYLLQDKRHPRSLAFCLERIIASLGTLPDNHLPQKQIKGIAQKLEKARLKKLATAGLADFLDDIQIALGKADQVINETYFYQ